MTPKRRQPVERVRLGALFLGITAIFAGVTAWAIYDEFVVRRPWKAIRAEFSRLAVDRGEEPVAIEIEQVHNPGLGIVDRCSTCHVAIDQPGFDDSSVPQPYRTHPDRSQWLGAHHPPKEFGCTVCHHGQGPQTKGVAHRSFDHGLADPFWESPLLEGALVQSTCVGCHPGSRRLKGAEVWARGRELFEDLRCYGCHETSHIEDPPPGGPPLAWTRTKMSFRFAVEWIREPQAVRPHTRMPDHWPEPVQLDGTPVAHAAKARADWKLRRAEEPRALAAFLGSLPHDDLPRPPRRGDPDRGKRLYDELGCRGCHEPDDDGTRPVGPALERIGDKASRAWLWAWLDNPRALWPDAEMPDLRLGIDERVDLVAYLASLRGEGDRALHVEPSDRDWPEDPRLIERGKELVAHYGCHGCHDIPGFEHSGVPGPELIGFGDKTADLLEWGRLNPPAHEPPIQMWTRWKVQQPRRMTRPGVELVMPTNHLSTAEVEALTTFVLSDREFEIPQEYRRSLSERERVLARGDALVERFGCRECHEIGRDEERVVDGDGEFLYVDYVPHGGRIRRFYDQPAEAPPSLTFGGMKLRYDWTYAYLMSPEQIRPWLPGRMPTFDLTREDARALVAHLAAMDGEPFPFRERKVPALEGDDLEDAIWLFTEMQCLKCHELSTMEGDVSQRAPDLALASERLTAEWIRQFLLEPQRIQPGTRMPTLFPRFDDDIPNSYTTPYPERLDGDVHRQVDALVALTLRFGSDPSLAKRIRDANASSKGDER